LAPQKQANRTIMTTRAERIEQILDNSIELQHLEVLDESHNHSVPQGAQTHFKVVAVSPVFEQQSRINRHRMINTLLQTEFDEGMHALALHTYTQAEWRKRFGEAPMSPPCAGGSGK
jgi:BolA family transcriptional regulator, general stress-responsive regulator